MSQGAHKTNEFRYTVHNQSPKTTYNLYNDRRTFNMTSIASFIKHDNFTVHDISERIVLITFNSTNAHIVNVSQTDITQFCSRNSRPVCQPDMESQRNSLLIADLDSDGSQELISYISTFVSPDEETFGYEGGSWHLRSVVKVVRLETELPKLFELAGHR